MTESTEDLEKPAKRWEVRDVAKSVEVQSKQLESIDTKLDRIIDNQVTPQHVDDKIKIVRDETNTKFAIYAAKYDPIVDNVKWLTRAVIGAVIGLIASIASQLWGGGK